MNVVKPELTPHCALCFDVLPEDRVDVETGRGVARLCRTCAAAVVHAIQGPRG